MPRILIAEDSPTMRALLRSSFEEQDGAVKMTEATRGFEALCELPSGSYDRVERSEGA